MDSSMIHIPLMKYASGLARYATILATVSASDTGASGAPSIYE